MKSLFVAAYRKSIGTAFAFVTVRCNGWCCWLIRFDRKWCWWHRIRMCGIHVCSCCIVITTKSIDRLVDTVERGRSNHGIAVTFNTFVQIRITSRRTTLTMRCALQIYRICLLVFFFARFASFERRIKLPRISNSDVNKWLIFNLHIVRDLCTVNSLDHYKIVTQPAKVWYWIVTLSHWIRLFMQIVCVCAIAEPLDSIQRELWVFCWIAQQTITFIYCAGSPNKKKAIRFHKGC